MKIFFYLTIATTWVCSASSQWRRVQCRHMLITVVMVHPFTAWWQEAGPQCPDVSLPAPEAADAVPGEVSHLSNSVTSSGFGLDRVCVCHPVLSLPSYSHLFNLTNQMNILCACVWLWCIQTQGDAKGPRLRCIHRWGEWGRRFHSVRVSWVGTCK